MRTKRVAVATTQYHNIIRIGTNVKLVPLPEECPLQLRWATLLAHILYDIAAAVNI